MTNKFVLSKLKTIIKRDNIVLEGNSSNDRNREQVEH